jgi:nucleotide-binding universal stress UspA family protein
MQHILAAIDFSPVSKAIVWQSAALADAFGAELTLLHVAAPDPDFVGYAVGPKSVRDSRAEELRAEHAELQTLSQALRDRGLTVHALLIEGPTVEKILEEADRVRADAIVVGSHGRGMLERVLLGSVSEGVVRGATCPVVVMPASGSEDS